MLQIRVWDDFFNEMLADAVRFYFYDELRKRRMFPFTEYVIDLSNVYKELDVPIGRKFSVDIAGVSADIFSFSYPALGVLIEIESPKNSKFQVQNNMRKLAIVAGEYDCACLQVVVPSLASLKGVTTLMIRKAERFFLKDEKIDDAFFTYMTEASLLLKNPVVDLRLNYVHYPKGFRKFAVPVKNLSWWIEMMMNSGLGRLAGRFRSGEFYRAYQKFVGVDDDEFADTILSEEDDFPALAGELYSLCVKAGVSSIFAGIDFFDFRKDFLFSGIAKDDNVLFDRWHGMEGERLVKVLSAGVEKGLFIERFKKDGVWDVVKGRGKK